MDGDTGRDHPADGQVYGGRNADGGDDDAVADREGGRQGRIEAIGRPGRVSHAHSRTLGGKGDASVAANIRRKPVRCHEFAALVSLDRRVAADKCRDVVERDCDIFDRRSRSPGNLAVRTEERNHRLTVVQGQGEFRSASPAGPAERQ